MEDASKMLTQEEIDAMVSKTSGKPAPAHKIMSTPAPAPANVKTVAAAPSPPSDVKQVPPWKPKGAAQQEAPEGSGNGHGHSHDECIAAGDINSLHERLAELANRISKLELMVSKMDNGNKNPAAQVNPATMKAAMQQIQNVSSQVEVISEGLRGTAGYNISKTFSCSSCGTVGVVAIKVKCTKCGQENWWGWWPKKK
jgi:tetrahydromethanopterin S-methyltransferase subunit G